MYEDDADGLSAEAGNHLLTTCKAQQLPSENGNDGSDIVVSVARSEGEGLIGNSTCDF